MESDDDQKVYTFFFYYNYFLCISNMDLVLENYFMLWNGNQKQKILMEEYTWSIYGKKISQL